MKHKHIAAILNPGSGFADDETIEDDILDDIDTGYYHDIALLTAVAVPSNEATPGEVLLYTLYDCIKSSF